jgi:hypothetical protein
MQKTHQNQHKHTDYWATRIPHKATYFILLDSSQLTMNILWPCYPLNTYGKCKQPWNIKMFLHVMKFVKKTITIMILILSL